MIKKTPCLGCIPPKRHAECHSTCPDYIPWQKANEQEYAKRKLICEATVIPQKKRKKTPF